MNRPVIRVLALLSSFLAPSLVAPPEASARPRAKDLPELSLIVNHEQSTEPLKIEMIWVLAPGERNPHRKNWVVSRNLEWVDLLPVQKAEGNWGVRFTALRANSKSYVREPGPWFRPLSDFSCSTEPYEDFATPEGARVAAEAAADAWSQVLSDEKLKLATLVERIAAKDAASAVAQARLSLGVWNQSVESEWRARYPTKSRMAEWRHYLGTAKASGVCPRAKNNPAPGPRPIEARMRPPSEGAAPKNEILARAPARRWDGLFTIRVTVEIAGRKLLGQFLIDSGAGASILNPYWLEAQGIPPAYVEIPGVKPQRVSWAGGAGFARRARVDAASVSGLRLPQTEFLLLETELFGPPNEVAACCDGILGTDFLREHVVEFVPGKPNGVNIWRKEGFNLPGWIWAEASESPQGDMISGCEASAGQKTLQGFRWDTGSVAGLEVHTPWKSVASSAAEWRLSCAGHPIISRVRPGGASLTAFGNESTGPLAVKYPAVSVGMPVIGRGRFALDLPHGRIWFDPASLNEPVLRNRSGLVLEFFYLKGQRILRVKGIRPGSPADRLSRQGLRAGSQVIKIGDLDAEDLDLWEVERHLAGTYGPDVVLTWKTGSEMKVASLATK